MKKTRRNAFTIVELVIVIAVIAILAAVLIPTFTSIVRKANVSADVQLIRNLNTALKIDGKEHKTMQDALDAAFDSGFDVEKINAKASDNKILWDKKNDMFCYLEKDATEPSYHPESSPKQPAKDVDLWEIVKILPELANQKYSMYYAGDEVVENKQIKVGFDAGTSDKVKSISYVNDGEAQSVVIRTNGGSLTINDTNNDSEQIQYGLLTSVEVTTGNSCFYANGTIGAMDIKQGKVVANKGSYVGLSKAAEGTLVVEQDGGVFVIPTNSTTSDIPSSVANQLSGYSVSDGKIVADESREANSFYNIGTLEQLINFRDSWNKGLIEIKKVKLTADFDLSGSNWYPIGTWEYPFNGTFDGNGHTINGLYANSTDADHKGLYANGDSVGYGETYGFFGIVGNGDTTISTINFKNVNIDIYDGKDVGAVIGYVPNNSKFISAGPKTTNEKYDGFISYDKWLNNSSIGTHNLTLDNIEVSGTIKGGSHVAGLVGKIYTTGDIAFTNCLNKASVSGKGGYIGGLVGIQSSKTNSFKIINCTNEGDITADASNVGIAGLVGRVNDNQKTDEARTIDFVIENCTNSGNVKSSVSVAAGLIFLNSVKSVTIKNCTNTGDVISTKSSATGIITNGSISESMTYEGTIKNSGNISGIQFASGIGLSKKTILKNATIINSGAVQATNDGSVESKNYAGGLASDFSGTIIVEGESSFENTGNISVSTVWGESYAGGVFGLYSNSSDVPIDFNLAVNIHDCTIKGVGAGRWFHNTGYGADVMKNDPVAVGGFAGRVNSKFISYNNVVVEKVSFSALASETTKPYKPTGGTAAPDPETRQYFMAGAFAGIICNSVSTEVDNKLINASIKDNNFEAVYKGFVVGCSYNSSTTTSIVVLKYSGNYSSNGELSPSGFEKNNATIELIAE